MPYAWHESCFHPFFCFSLRSTLFSGLFEEPWVPFCFGLTVKCWGRSIFQGVLGNCGGQGTVRWVFGGGACILLNFCQNSLTFPGHCLERLHGLSQWRADKRLTTSSLRKREPWFTFAGFWGVNTSAIADFKRPTWCHRRQSQEGMHTVGSSSTPRV